MKPIIKHNDSLEITSQIGKKLYRLGWLKDNITSVHLNVMSDGTVAVVTDNHVVFIGSCSDGEEVYNALRAIIIA